jgi:hypothetical protein
VPPVGVKVTGGSNVFSPRSRKLRFALRFALIASNTSPRRARLKELGALHEQNVLSDEEFEREKAKLLG